MVVNVFESITDVYGNPTLGFTSINNYWSFATDPTLGVGTPWGLQRVVVVGIITIIAQALTTHRYVGVMMTGILAFVVASIFDAFNEVISLGMYVNDGGEVSPLVRVWAPQSAAYFGIMNIAGAIFGTVFSLFIGTNPFVQIGIDYDDVAKGANRILVKGVDVLISWIIAPILFALIEWIAFWYIFPTHASAYRMRWDVVGMWAVTAVVVVIIYAVYLTLIDYSTMLVMKFWDVSGDKVIKMNRKRYRRERDEEHYAAVSKTGEDTPVTVADDGKMVEIDGAEKGRMAVLGRHIVSGLLLELALLPLFAFSWGKIFPGDAGYFFQSLVGMVIGLALALLVRLLLYFWPPFATLFDKIRVGQPIYSTAWPIMGLRSANKVVRGK
jgi:hypothetical protein